MSPVFEILSELDARGITVRAVEGAIKLKPAGALDPDLLERVRVHKPEILAALSRVRRAPIPTEPCRACSGRLFWRSIHGVLICWRCHPGSETLVQDILYLERRAGAWSCEVKARIN
jgi:hypothetical protein